MVLCPQVQIHSFDAVVSEKEAVIQEVSALRCFIIYFTVALKLLEAVLIILYIKFFEAIHQTLVQCKTL